MMTSAAGIAVGIAVAAGLTFSLAGGSTARAQNLGSPAFANPSEVRYRDKEKVLRAVMELSSGKYVIPNVGTESLRQFRGWDPARPAPAPTTDIRTGPTLRARLGDRVEISFLNKIDDTAFPYSFDTTSKPPHSSFGCDKSGDVYPGNDIFPNCFHGSSTANIHFHGTHAPPDGLGDNVLVQVLPDAKQADYWSSTFNELFTRTDIPEHWMEMPEKYRTDQEKFIRAHDTLAADQAARNNLPKPESLWDANQKMIDADLWPQYLMGAFPNFFEIPDYSTPGYMPRPNGSTGKYIAGQAPGTHWYHAHKHGSTSLHILNGLAGALIIESTQPRGYDQVIRGFYSWGNTYADHEKIIVFQQFDPTQNLERIKNPGGGGPPAQGRGSKQVLINGKLTPTITMRPGEVQLWRLVNATEGNNAGVITKDLFTTTGFNFRQTAQDGVQFSPDNYERQPFLTTGTPYSVSGGLTLAGGNRADLLVQAPPQAGVYTFVSGKTARNPAGTTMFFVNVTGSAVTRTKPFPLKADWAPMPDFLADLPEPGTHIPNPDSPVKFQWEKGRTGTGLNTAGFPPHFMINDKQFEETGSIVDQCMPLNGLQDWVLENYTSPLHPFHIHINPFQVVSIETPAQPAATPPTPATLYKPPDNRLWQDVIALPPAYIPKDGSPIVPGRITIRQRYVDFTGTFVLHCHILAHEDRGMMQLVRIVPAGGYKSACQDHIPIHH
jgi:FtsP/CotA-like multicopper oxidase with cupredoxin domain